jgi:hypothetical protein
MMPGARPQGGGSAAPRAAHDAGNGLPPGRRQARAAPSAVGLPRCRRPESVRTGRRRRRRAARGTGGSPWCGSVVPFARRRWRYTCGCCVERPVPRRRRRALPSPRPPSMKLRARPPARGDAGQHDAFGCSSSLGVCLYGGDVVGLTASSLLWSSGFKELDRRGDDLLQGGWLLPRAIRHRAAACAGRSKRRRPPKPGEEKGPPPCSARDERA